MARYGLAGHLKVWDCCLRVVYRHLTSRSPTRTWGAVLWLMRHFLLLHIVGMATCRYVRPRYSQGQGTELSAVVDHSMPPSACSVTLSRHLWKSLYNIGFPKQLPLLGEKLYRGDYTRHLFPFAMRRGLNQSLSMEATSQSRNTTTVTLKQSSIVVPSTILLSDQSGRT